MKQAAAMLKGAKNVVILAGRTSRSMDGWNERIALAEASQRQGDHRTQDRRLLPDRPSAARRRPGRQRDPAGRAGGGESRRRDPQPRLGRSRRRVQGHVRRRDAEGEGHLGQQRLPHPSRLEHGLSGPAGGRPAAAGDARRGRSRAQQGARRHGEAVSAASRWSSATSPISPPASSSSTISCARSNLPAATAT